MTLPHYDVAYLKNLSDEDYIQLVRDHLGPDNEDLWFSLTDISLIGRTQRVLSSFHRDLEDQLAYHRAKLAALRAEFIESGSAATTSWFSAQRDHGDWRHRALYVRRLIQQRIAYIRDRAATVRATPEEGAGIKAMRRKHNLDALYDLAIAIIAHRDDVLSGSEDGPDPDDVLWGHLQSITVATSGGDVSLREWVQHVGTIKGNDVRDMVG